jgi:hypothetical protein
VAGRKAVAPKGTDRAEAADAGKVDRRAKAAAIEAATVVIAAAGPTADASKARPKSTSRN